MEMRFKELFSKYNGPNNSSGFEKIKENNPTLWKKLKQQFDTGRQIVLMQLNNGLERLNEQILRSYLKDYATRYLKYGPNSFPTSFNALEPFFLFNHHNSIIQLIEQEESYGISLIDFLDFATEPTFKLEDIDLYENIPEKTIYHFSFTTGFDEINFSNSNGKTFIIGGLSLIRQGNEVSILMQAGESYDKKEAEEYLKTHTRKSLEESISTFKKSLGFEIDYEGETEVVHFQDRDDFWQYSVAILFDLEARLIDIRHVARDENISYNIYTDDFNAIFSRENSLSPEEMKKYIINHTKELSKYDAVFDFAKYCLALPYYVFENEEKLVDATYNTSLNSIIKGPVSRRKFALVPSKFKIFAKPFYYLESNSQTVIESKELNDNSFKIEKSGYWKRISIDEEGFDKKGRKIVGKTWVERNDIFYSNPKGVTIVNKIKIYNDKNAGYIYVMRQPSHEENIFKVGLTQRSPEARKKELSNTSSIDNFFVINSYYTKDCINAEKQIHKILEKYRLTSRREFFRCDLKIILDACESTINEINK
jgi:hypothetical protein